MGAQAVVRKRGEGDAFWMLGGLYEVKVSSEDTDGAMTIMDMLVPAGMGPPPHTHAGAETVYVVEGQLRYQIGGETFEGGPGTLFHIPAGIVENFEPLTQARVLVAYAPGGIERFFAEAGEVAESRELPPAPEVPPDVDRLAEIAARYGMQIQVPAAG